MCAKKRECKQMTLPRRKFRVLSFLLSGSTHHFTENMTQRHAHVRMYVQSSSGFDLSPFSRERCVVVCCYCHLIHKPRILSVSLAQYQYIMSSSSSSIPLMRSPVDNQMETGPNGNNLAATATRRHFVDDIQRSSSSKERGFLDLDGVRRLYGSGLAMCLATERQIHSNNGGRLPGMPESNLALDTVMGNHTTLDFADVMGRLENAPVTTVQDPHSAMQRKMKL